jgi:hypothetical protein
MKLNSSVVSFGRHESFPLRYGWLTKGVKALIDDPRILERESATVSLGVGKNMVLSIRYWLLATRIIKKNSANALELTPTGAIIFGEQGDPYLEDEGTIWLLHWLLATNPTGATAIYWFFNHFHKAEYTADEVATALRDFVKQNVNATVSTPTMKGDAALLQRMYVRSIGNNRVPIEEALDSPLSTLGLQERVDSRTYRGIPMERGELPLGIFAYAVAQLFECRGAPEITIEQLMYSSMSHCAPGAVFRMTEDGLIKKLEELSAARPTQLRIDQTAGIHQVYKLSGFSSRSVLEAYYAQPAIEAAA